MGDPPSRRAPTGAPWLSVGFREDASLGELRERDSGGLVARVAELAGRSRALEWLVHPLTRGDPVSPLRWMSKSTSRWVMP